MSSGPATVSSQFQSRPGTNGATAVGHELQLTHPYSGEAPMKSLRFTLVAVLAMSPLLLPLACGDSTSPSSNMGTVVVKLTDAPFPTDQVASVNVYVVRVESRTATADDAEADANLDNGSAAGWTTLAQPNATFNLMALQNGATATLGEAALAPGTYNGLRLIIDPSKSNVTLKNGTVLNGGSTPNVSFPSASRSGLKILLSKPLTVVAGTTTTLLVDFDVSDSFVMRGNDITKNGLLFKPVIRGSVIDAATVNATVRLANATNTALDLLRSGAAVTGATNIAFGASSACSMFTAAAPALAIALTGTTTPIAGLTLPTLVAGTSYTIVAYPSATGTQFATLANTYTPAAGQAGLRVFNATTGATGYDVFVTTVGAPLGTATLANALSGVASSFVSVPAGSSQIRITATGTTPVLLDLGAQSLTAGQNVTLIIAPPATGSTTLRGFLVPSC
jgi:hypothetical protein